MRFTIQAISAILALITPTLADAVAPADLAVVKLTAANFESFLKEHPLVLAEFFAPWCGHCKSLGPEYVAAADKLQEVDIPLAQIDCTEEEALCQTQGIRGYPTLKVFRGPSDAKPYEGARKAEAIELYMLKQLRPAIAELDLKSAEAEGLASKEAVVVFVLTDKKTNGTFTEVANLRRDKLTFFAVKDEEATKKYGKKPTVVVYRSDFAEGDEPAVLTGETDPEKIAAFIDSELKPFFGEINGETFQDYMMAKTPLAYLFYTSPEEREEWAKKLVPFAKEYRGKVNFVGLDAVRFGKHAENLNQEEKFPLFALHDLEENKKYGLDQSKDLSLKDIEELLQKYSKGEAKAIIKSEEIPETQENAVMKLVAYTHDEVVQDTDKDVFVMYHATWCGHCKRLAPTFEEFAALYKNDENASQKVVIANIEATQNDVDVDIQGFPTLILYPAGDKEHPVTFESSRDLESLAAFVKEHGTHKIDGLALKAKKDEEGEGEDEEDDEAVHDEL